MLWPWLVPFRRLYERGAPRCSVPASPALGYSRGSAHLCAPDGDRTPARPAPLLAEYKRDLGVCAAAAAAAAAGVWLHTTPPTHCMEGDQRRTPREKVVSLRNVNPRQSPAHSPTGHRLEEANLGVWGLKVQCVWFRWKGSTGRNWIWNNPSDVFTSVFHPNCTNCCFLYPRMGLLCLNTLFLHRERVHSKEATMFFFTVLRT